MFSEIMESSYRSCKSARGVSGLCVRGEDGSILCETCVHATYDALYLVEIMIPLLFLHSSVLELEVLVLSTSKLPHEQQSPQ